MGLPRLRRKQGRLREGGGLIGSIDPVGAALKAGFDAAGIADPALLAANAHRLAALVARGWYSKHSLSGMELDGVLRAQSLAESSSIVVCGLSCNVPEEGAASPPSEDPRAFVAPFAQRNHYSAAIAMLRGAVDGLCRDLNIRPQSVRFFSNSRLPERAFFLSAGLGAVGANGLAQAAGLGSRFVIAGAVLPIARRRLAAGSASPAPDPCGSCRLCVDACPVGAIRGGGLVDPDVCLQGMASGPGCVPDAVKEKWGLRLYGCDDCQSACPKNAGLKKGSAVRAGEVGPFLSIPKILSLAPEGVTAMFKGTALGVSFLKPEILMRNALIAAGNARRPDLKSAIAPHAASGSPPLADAARWALERCG